MVNIKIVDSKLEWETFILSQPYQPFFQSWNWGQVQQKLGNQVFRIGLFENKKLIGISLAVLISAKRGNYLHVRHGPVLSFFHEQFDAYLLEIKKLSSERRADFVRISPPLEQDDETILFFKDRGFRSAPIHNMDAENAWVLDLDKSDEYLLTGMRKTTRYLVRKAQSMPITIATSIKTNDFEAFMKLYDVTSRRHKFIPHRGIREEFAIFIKENQAKLFLAKYKRKILAGAVVIYYGDQAVYHHGASSDQYKEIPAAYLLQWEAIKDARQMGKKLYNFWGVVPPEKPKHPWQGLTLFKTGFGGRRVNFIHAQDLPMSKNYWKTFTIETAWRIKRGY